MPCVAFGCRNKRDPNSQITFHRFPEDEEKRRLWITNIRRKKFTPTQYSRVCSVHFLPECFERTSNAVSLKEDALPTLLPLKRNRNHSIDEMLFIRPPKKVKPAPEVKPDISSFEAQENIRIDHSYCLPSSGEIKRKLEWQKEKIAELSRRSKSYRVAKDKLTKKLGNLVQVVKELKSKKRTSEKALRIPDLDAMSDIPKDILKRKRRCNEGKISRSSYSPELRTFALNLSLYSTKAYSYVRKTFDLCLPSLSTIRSWNSNGDNRPSLTRSSCDILQSETNDVIHSDLNKTNTNKS